MTNKGHVPRWSMHNTAGSSRKGRGALWGFVGHVCSKLLFVALEQLQHRRSVAANRIRVIHGGFYKRIQSRLDGLPGLHGPVKRGAWKPISQPKVLQQQTTIPT